MGIAPLLRSVRNAFEDDPLEGVVIGRPETYPAELPAAPTAGLRAVGAMWRSLRAWQAWRIVAPALAILVLAVVLNGQVLLREAESMPFGPSRDRWVATWEPIATLSHTIYLDRPREFLDRVVGNEVISASPEPPASRSVIVPGVAADPSPTAPAAPELPPLEPVRRLRFPTADAPLRLWVAGDSMSSEFGPALARVASETGVMQTRYETEFSSGLTRPDFFDWPARLKAIVGADESPEVLILVFGANDAQGIKTAAGDIYQPGEDGWLSEYRLRVARAMDSVTAPNRLVLWIGQPVMQAETLSLRMSQMDEIYRSEAARRNGVVFVDTWDMFAGPAGGYAPHMEMADGSLKTIRNSDGVHLTAAGAGILADAVLDLIRAEAGLDGEVNGR